MVVTVSIDEFAGGPDEVQDARAFIKLFNRATEEKDDAHRLRVFANYLEVDGEVEKWFEELLTAEKVDWPSVQTAFLAAFKHAPIVEKSVADCEEELMGLRLSTAELVSKVEGKNGRKVWAHMVMADRMLALAKGAGVAAGSNLIRTVINNLPRGLKERVAGTYANWEEFVKALKEVDMEAVVASVEGLMRDEKVRREDKTAASDGYEVERGRWRWGKREQYKWQREWRWRWRKNGWKERASEGAADERVTRGSKERASGNGSSPRYAGGEEGLPRADQELGRQARGRRVGVGEDAISVEAGDVRSVQRGVLQVWDSGPQIDGMFGVGGEAVAEEGAGLARAVCENVGVRREKDVGDKVV
ncbi:hypothetical protein EST38_g5754 [Candolleomyces aberdarensis]|uniref:Uncharacterized protein n=1 Tax=Candolleomyces aberdarensis TaxID=2316362 RepID=A0A4Q2DMD5_9AGAR|nr:hypothetical protein EST38_g5754 [Candolleomyces aberdarensis]